MTKELQPGVLNSTCTQVSTFPMHVQTEQKVGADVGKGRWPLLLKLELPPVNFIVTRFSFYIFTSHHH